MRPPGQNFISTRILLIPSASSLPTPLRAAQSHSAYLHPLRFLFPLSLGLHSFHPTGHQTRARPRLSSSPSATPSQPDPLPPHSYPTRVYGLGLSLSCFRASDCLSHEQRSISVQLVLSNHFSIQLNNEVTQRTSLPRIVPHPSQPCRARVLGSCLTTSDDAWHSGSRECIRRHRLLIACSRVSLLGLLQSSTRSSVSCAREYTSVLVDADPSTGREGKPPKSCRLIVIFLRPTTPIRLLLLLHDRNPHLTRRSRRFDAESERRWARRPAGRL
jgi:hypothetical protein